MLLTPLAVATLVIFVGLLGTFAVAVRRRDGAAVVNGVVTIAVALVPVLVEVATAITIPAGSELTAWVGLAGLLHMVGMLGVYESVWWWDHLTHTVSAALVAALCYGGVLVVVGVSRGVAAGVVIGLTLAGGLCWELIELVARALGRRYDIDPVLVYYGLDDTAFDLVFNLVGAGIIVAFDVDLFVSLAAQYPDASGGVLIGATVIVVGATVLMAVGLTLAEAWPEPGAER